MILFSVEILGNSELPTVGMFACFVLASGCEYLQSLRLSEGSCAGLRFGRGKA